jgi:hypothetical protein
MERFELSTPCSRSRCATRLRYIPIWFADWMPILSRLPVGCRGWVDLRARGFDYLSLAEIWVQMLEEVEVHPMGYTDFEPN